MRLNARKRASILRAALQGDPSARFLVVEQVDRAFNPGHFFGEEGAVWYGLAPSLLPVERFGAWNLHRRWDRLWNLRQFAYMVETLQGDTIEFGCHAGASSFVIMSALPTGHHWCVDSFEGLSNPDPMRDGQAWKRGDLAVTEMDLTANLAEFKDRLSVAKGWIPEVLRDLPPSLRFRFAHIDVDLYEPTLASLEYLGERMVNGGVIVCDDYGSAGCPGAKDAVDEFASRNSRWMVLHLSSAQALITLRQFSH